MGTEEIFPGRILKFGRHLKRVENNFNFSTRDHGHLHACAHTRMAHFFLKIDFLLQHMGTSPQLVTVSIADYGSCFQYKKCMYIYIFFGLKYTQRSKANPIGYVWGNLLLYIRDTSACIFYLHLFIYLFIYLLSIHFRHFIAWINIW